MLDFESVKKAITKKMLDLLKVDDIYVMSYKNISTLVYYSNDFMFFKKIKDDNANYSSLATYKVDYVNLKLIEAQNIKFQESTFLAKMDKLDLRDLFNSSRIMIGNSILTEYFPDLDSCLVKIINNKIILETADDSSLVVSSYPLNGEVQENRFLIKKTQLRLIVECINNIKDKELELKVSEDFLIVNGKEDKLYVRISRMEDKPFISNIETKIMGEKWNEKKEVETNVYIEKNTKEVFYKIGYAFIKTSYVRGLMKLADTVFLSESENFYRIIGEHFEFFTCKPLKLVEELEEELIDKNSEEDDEDYGLTELDEKKVIECD